MPARTKNDSAMKKGYTLLESFGQVQSAPVPPDIYGVTMTIVMQDLPSLFNPALRSLLSTARLAFGCIAAATNLWLQLMILWYVNAYLVDGAVHLLQENYAQFHREIFDRHGTFLPEIWRTWTGPYMELCNMPVTRERFAMAIVFLWCARMISEIQRSLDLTKNMWALQTLPLGQSPTEGMKYVKNELGEIETIKVHSVSCTVRFALMLTVMVPKVLVAMALLYCGLRFLLATQSLTDVILNALALEAVISIDELMYEAFTPKATRSHIEKTILIFAGKDKSPEQQESERFYNTLFYWLGLLVVGAFSYFYPTDLQQVLPNYHHDLHLHCDSWFDKYYEPPCAPFSRSEDCFPFGEAL